MVLIGDKESFLSFKNFPWFRDASVGTIHNVGLFNNNHLYWPDRITFLFAPAAF
jgi:hypothetical protein